MSSTKGEGGSAKMWCYSLSLFSKMGDKGESGFTKSQKRGDVIYGWPLIYTYTNLLIEYSKNL